MFKKIILVFLIILIVSPLLMYVSWRIAPVKILNVLVLDKTVLESKTQEHLSLSWVLNNEKYSHSITGSYNHKSNYFGFFPNDSGKYKIKDFNNENERGIDSLANLYKVAYFTDLYGIYRGEWNERYPKSEINPETEVDNSMERTQKIYGGLSPKELSFLVKMKQKHKLIIAEFNTIASPTSHEVRRGFEREFNMQWTGWVGRYYDILDTLKNKELPRWMKRNYLKQHQNKWPFTQSGIVFVKEDDQIEILENKLHLSTDLPIIETNEFYCNQYGLTAKMKYPYWFDIIRTDTSNAVVSSYRITPTVLGRELLKQYGIPEVFPAVVAHVKSDYSFYYFAGDFCDNPIEMRLSKFKYIHIFSSLFYSKNYAERVSFFWNFYRPLVSEILADRVLQSEID